VVELDLPDAAPPTGGESIPLDVVYEDGDLLVIDKPAGMVVHPAAGQRSGTLVNALLGRGGEWSAAGGAGRPGIVHRLDKGTSGLIVVARHDLAHRRLAEQLAGRTMSRAYLAVARGEVPAPSGEVDGPIGRDPRHRQRMAVVAAGRFARTRYRVLERLRGHTLLRADLETGRTHQVRVHLAAIGHPVVGDELYGRRRPGDPERPLLHAFRLRFVHPRTGRDMEFESPPPADLAGFVAAHR
jgi:23S rRNA pseudouridine1911/1915/1917 synthase